MLNPDLVLLDEPSMGLAPILVDEVFRIIERLKAEGVTNAVRRAVRAAALNVADYGYVLRTVVSRRTARPSSCATIPR